MDDNATATNLPNIKQSPILKKDENKGLRKKDTKTQELEKKVKELEDNLKRAVADYRNLERRIDEEKKDWIKFSNRELLLKLFEAFEILFIAEKHVSDEGLKLSIKKIVEVLKGAGVERIETVNKKYDPETMECIEVVGGENDMVLEEIRPGFTLYGKVLKPAKVKVGRELKVEN